MASRFTSFATGAILVLLVLLVGERYLRLALYAADEPRPVTVRGELARDEDIAIQVFATAAPSVVHVFAGQGAGAGDGQLLALGSGSGVIWDAAGHIVTNHHVIADASRLGVRLASGETLPAVLVGAAPDYDLAVVRIDNAATPLRPLAIGRSDDLVVGQAAYAIGNPFGLDQTLTTGVVSALDRQLPTSGRREIPGVIQTDAAINPGNSGGPLLDSAGRLIGINTAILSGTGASAGVGFAVPVDLVNWVVPQLIREGRVPRPIVGIVAAPGALAAQAGVSGIVVVEVQPGSPADQAGLRGLDPATGRLGDVIVAVDGEPVSSVAEMSTAFARLGVGSEVMLSVRRDGAEREITMRLAEARE